MTIYLNSLISEVRSTLSDVPTTFLTDSQILNELEKAQTFCVAIVVSTTTESYLEKCIIVVATYYSYINYTTLSERQLGTLPPTSKIRLDALRRVAISFLQLVSNYPIDENLLLDVTILKDSKVAAISLSISAVNDDYPD
jgi:hypothetical protein